MTRNLEPGARRNLIGLKVSDDMLALVEYLRGETPVQDYLRGLISEDGRRVGGGAWWPRPENLPDWERRARTAERKLEKMMATLGQPACPDHPHTLMALNLAAKWICAGADGNCLYGLRSLSENLHPWYQEERDPG